MNRMMFAAAMAMVTVGGLAAVTVGPDWCVAYPQEGSKEVNSALRFAAEEVADDINEATGLQLKAVSAPKPGDSWFLNVGRIAKPGKDRKGEIDMLWSPNLESRSMVAPNAMGKLVFK